MGAGGCHSRATPTGAMSCTRVHDCLHYKEADMFVRWQRKQRADRYNWGPLLCAVLVDEELSDPRCLCAHDS